MGSVRARTGQEVDPEFVRVLQDPRASDEAASAPRQTPAVAGYQQRPTNFEPWWVAVSDEDDTAALIVAVRSTRASASTVVESEYMYHRDYTRKQKTHHAYSRLLTAQIVWLTHMNGVRSTQILNVHFHHLAAKKDFSSSLFAGVSVVTIIHDCGDHPRLWRSSTVLEVMCEK